MGSVSIQPRLPYDGERVFITLWYNGVFGMQVCVLDDTVTDKEILDYCNEHNPSGTTGGWRKVINNLEDCKEQQLAEECKPGPCAEVPGRIHKVVLC